MDLIFVLKDGVVTGPTPWFWVFFFLIVWAFWSFVSALSVPEIPLVETIEVSFYIALLIEAIALVVWGFYTIFGVGVIIAFFGLLLVLILSAVGRKIGRK